MVSIKRQILGNETRGVSPRCGVGSGTRTQTVVPHLQEAHGRKLLLVRFHGTVYCTDAHCFHMVRARGSQVAPDTHAQRSGRPPQSSHCLSLQGTSLAGGDIEDSGVHACIVCPAHRYRVSALSADRSCSTGCCNLGRWWCLQSLQPRPPAEKNQSRAADLVNSAGRKSCTDSGTHML